MLCSTCLSLGHGVNTSPNLGFGHCHCPVQMRKLPVKAIEHPVQSQAVRKKDKEMCSSHFFKYPLSGQTRVAYLSCGEAACRWGQGRPGGRSWPTGRLSLACGGCPTETALGLPGAPRRRSHLAVEVGEALWRSVADGTFQNRLQ